MNSVTAHRPLRDTAGAVSLRYRCSAPPSPRHHAFCFCLARFPFYFFGMVVAGEVGFLLREKLTEFKCGLGFAKLFSGDMDLAKPRLNFPPAERGLGNECGRVLDSGKKSEKALEYIKSS